jgi:ferrous-iron efflux pump FieF
MSANHAHSHASSHAHGRTIEETAKVTRLATRLSVAAAAVLIVVKGVIWWASGSVALLASLADSSLDLVASLATFFAVRYAVAPPDREHRFGHGKAEAFAGLLQAGLVFASGALVGREAIAGLIHPKPVEHQGWAMIAMLISIAVTAVLVIAQTRLLKQAGSVAVAGDRAHYAADLASNIAALIGIGAAALTGQLWIDAAAGLLVALWLVWGAVGVFRGASLELLDHELDLDARALIKATVMTDDRIRNVHQLRTRSSGPMIHIQFHAALEPHITLAQAHEIIDGAETRLLEVFPAADIIIHADPDGLDEVHAAFT